MPPGRTVLVVEDESLVRMYAVDVLEDAGYAVAEAGDAGEALAVLELRADIGVVFTDINMPGELDGFALARRVHERRPDIHIILTSGKLQVSRDQLVDDAEFVAKPYEPETVVRLVAAVLG